MNYLFVCVINYFTNSNPTFPLISVDELPIDRKSVV